MIKCFLVYTLFWMLVFHTSCAQKQTEPHQDNINYNIKDTVTSYGPNTMVRNVKKGSNGTILFAASWGGVFRYDGKLFTNITSKIGSRRYWDVLEDRRGNIWFASTDPEFVMMERPSRTIEGKSIRIAGLFTGDF